MVLPEVIAKGCPFSLPLRPPVCTYVLYVCIACMHAMDACHVCMHALYVCTPAALLEVSKLTGRPLTYLLTYLLTYFTYLLTCLLTYPRCPG